MSLRNRGGMWHFRFKLHGKEYGETTDLAATEENTMQAQLIESKYKDALLEGQRPKRRIIVRKFSDAAVEFLDWAKAHYREHPSSYNRIKTSFASLKEFFGIDPVSLIDEGRIEAYKTMRVNVHEVRDITIRHDIHALSTFFRFAILQHWVFANPVDGVDIPSDADAERMHILTTAEEEDYFRRVRRFPNLYDVGRLMINQGIRPEEATVLAKTDIDLKRGEIYIRKGKSKAAKRTLYMTSESRKIFKRRMVGDSRWIFPSERKPGNHIGRINSAHDTIVEEAAKEGVVIDWVPYDFRHTFATRIAQGGVDLVTLAALLGHESIRLVKKYVHPTAEHKKAAMATYDRAIKETEKKTKSAPKPERKPKLEPSPKPISKKRSN